MNTYVITDGDYSNYHIVKIFQCETVLPNEFTLFNLWARANGLPEVPENPRVHWGSPEWNLKSGEIETYYKNRFSVREAHVRFAAKRGHPLLEVFFQWLQENYTITVCEYEELSFDI